MDKGMRREDSLGRGNGDPSQSDPALRMAWNYAIGRQTRSRDTREVVPIPRPLAPDWKTIPLWYFKGKHWDNLKKKIRPDWFSVYIHSVFFCLHVPVRRKNHNRNVSPWVVEPLQTLPTHARPSPQWGRKDDAISLAHCLNNTIF